MNKILILLLVLAGFSMISSGLLMPEIPNFFLQQQLIFHKSDLGITVPGAFTCECVPMPDPNNPDTNDDNIPDCGLTNLNCDAGPCQLIPDYCEVCSVSGTSCDISPNVPGSYFNSATMCNIDTTCP